MIPSPNSNLYNDMMIIYNIFPQYQESIEKNIIRTKKYNLNINKITYVIAYRIL